MVYIDRIDHPCFDELAHSKIGRIHLPVAPRCNIQCGYCSRVLNIAENRPGVSFCILSPRQALERTRKIISQNNTIKVVGIAGSGDPLANDETFETLYLIHKEYPDLIKCISTNGLMLSERVEIVKVNSVFVPEINGDSHLVKVAQTIKKLGITVMNIMPLIPMGVMASLKAPTFSELNEIRDKCEEIIRQFRACKQCRADAIGIPGEKCCFSII